MTHIGRLQEFHKAIRREELQNIFSQKRIKLLQSLRPIAIEEQIDYQNMNAGTLRHLAAVCQTEPGIQATFELRIEHEIEKFLTEEYLNTVQQRYATSILCNLHFIDRQTPPSSSFTSSIIKLLVYGNSEIVDNCVNLLFNIACEHQSWRQNLITQYKICSILCQKYRKEGLSKEKVVSILKTMLKMVRGPFSHDSFKLFYPIMVELLGDTMNNDNQIIAHAYYTFYYLALKFPRQAISYIVHDSLLTKFMRIAPHLKETRFLFITLSMIHMMITELNSSAIKKDVLPYLQKTIENKQMFSKKNIKNQFIEVVIMILQEGKLLAQEFLSINMGHRLLSLFQQENDPEILHILVHLFSIIIVNIDISPQAELILSLLDRVELICPSEIETIGFIKETQMKAKKRASFAI